MPKKLLIHPNERVDIPDFVRASHTYTQESVSFNALRSLLDKRSRVLDGFRVEIPNQTANPGQVTLFNGAALDRTGRVLNNEDQVNTSKTVTLTGATTNFYLEIEFVESASDTDSRAFWDPTFDQASPIPDGKEFQVNVATRTSPDWRVVSPVSTTGFQVTTDASSVRVPIAMLVTDASNQITGAVNPGLTQVFPSTVLELDHAASASILRVLDSRLFVAGDTVTVDVGGGAVQVGITVSSIDYENNQLSIAPALTVGHLAGAIVRRTSGAGTTMLERLVGIADLVTLPPAASDVQPRLWQGDEVRGSGLLTSKETFGSRDDTQLRSLKDHVDFLAAQIRELKFGSPRPDVVSLAPPAAFSATPRHYDPAGSVQGARTNTLSIGNGTTTFGDFNGTDEVPFIAAMAALPAGGGTIFVKAGTYTFLNTVAVTAPVTFIGAGKESVTVVNNVAAGPAFSFTLSDATDANKIILHELKFTVGTGDSLALTLETAVLVCTNTDFMCGIGLVGGTGVLSRIVARSCLFQPPAAAGAAILALAASSFEETLVNSSFTGCTFSEATFATPALICTLSNVVFTQCSFTGQGVFTSSSGALAFSDVAFYSCKMVVDTYISSVAGIMDRFTMNNCSVTIQAGAASTAAMLFTGAVSNVSISNTYIDSTWTGTAPGTQGRILRFSNNVIGLGVRDSRWGVNTGQAVDMITFEGAGSVHRGVTIDGNVFTQFHRGVRFVTTGTSYAVVISSNYFDASVENIEQQGVVVEDGYWEGTVRDNRFTGFNSSTATLKRGITVAAPTSGGANAKILNNAFDIGTSGNPAAANSAAIWIDGTTAVEMETVVAFNKIDAMWGVGNIYGINIIGGGTAPFHSIQVIGNQSTGTLSTTGGASTAAIGIRVVSANNCTIANNKIAETTVNAGDTAGIYVSALKSGVVQGNEIYGPIVTGSPSNYEAGVYITGANTNLRVCDNVVRETSFSTVQFGIHFDVTAACDNVSIDNNHVFMGADMIRGIIQNNTGSLKSFTCSGNRVAGIAAATTVTGIDVQLGASAFNIQVCNNMVSETTYDNSHTGISVEGTNAAEATCVQVNNNIVRGDLAGSGTRNSTTVGFGIELRDLRVFQCNNNLIDWADASIDAVSLFVSECEHGSVVGNVVRPGTPGGLGDITVASTIGGSIIGGNICGSSGQGAGTLSTGAAVDNLQGASNTATEFTNKIS